MPRYTTTTFPPLRPSVFPGVVWKPTDPDADLTTAWPALLREHYGQAFSIARRLAGLITVPGLLPAAGPMGMRSRALMKLALRVMGNLVTPEDADTLARVWRAAGRISVRLDDRPPFS